MRFPPSFLDEIRARVAVSDVVGRRVKLKRRGREFVGLSPFNAEKTPSFTVNDQKGFYHCFSSGKHGDIFRFLTEVEGLTFPEAVERLAAEAGLDVPKADPRAIEREEKRAGLIDVMEAAAAFFEEALQSGAGRGPRDYLDRRGLSEATIRRFRLGYAPNARHGLKQHLADKGITQEQMIEAGLLISGDDIPVSFDRFRDRVMFPIPDSRGRVIAFGGRALSADAQAKYLNSPETPLFHKGNVLYNFANARKAAHDHGTVLVTEGYMDVIALAQAGFEHGVAPLGTALTERQLHLLWRLAPEPVLCFDGDKAGLRAAQRAVETALPHLEPGRSLRFAFLPQGQDPDDLIRNAGSDAMHDVVQAARPLVDVLWDQETAVPLDTPERRAALEAALDGALGRIGNEAVRRHYREAMRGKLSQLWRGSRDRTDGAAGPVRRRERRRGDRNGRVPAAPAGPSAELRRNPLASGALGALHPREALILITLINHPALIEAHMEDIAGLELTLPALDSLRQRIVDSAFCGHNLDERALKSQLREQGFGPLLDRMERVVAHRGDWFVAPDAALADAETGWLHSVARQRKSITLRREVEAAERACAENLNEMTQERLFAAIRAMESFEGNEVAIDGYGVRSGRAQGA